MPGIRDRNLRSGNIHEELGVLLLRPVALVAPVPLWEDVGLDAVATLIKPEGGRRLIPEDAFAVQLKASSERVISYKDEDAARWVVNLGLPLFIGSVRLDGAAIDLFSTHGLFKVRPHPGLREVHLHLDGQAEHFGSPEVAHIHIGPPALSWSTDDFADREFPARAYPVLKGHIRAAQRNLQGRAMGHFEPVVWEPGRVPGLPGAFMIQSGGDRETSEALASLVAPMRALTVELGKSNQLAHLPAVFEFIKAMRALGTDPDPGDGLVKMAIAGPPDESRKQILGRLLAQGMFQVRFWWQGQQVTPPDWPDASTTPHTPPVEHSGEGGGTAAP
jgi:hypothetical protein